MEIKMTEKQFRRLLDLVYIGNWILNSTRGDDRIRQYDEVESLVFSQCLAHGMAPLTELYQGQLIPSQAFAEGGIHEAIMAYEDTTFFEILAQELALLKGEQTLQLGPIHLEMSVSEWIKEGLMALFFLGVTWRKSRKRLE